MANQLPFLTIEAQRVVLTDVSCTTDLLLKLHFSLYSDICGIRVVIKFHIEREGGFMSPTHFTSPHQSEL